MTEAEINSWLKLGMDIGGHTKTHPDLTNISRLKAQKEIGDCKKELEQKYKVIVTDFCYPFGKFNEFISNMAKDCGYLSATTMQRGRVNLKSNRFSLPRIPINYRTLPHVFIAKILTQYEDKR